MASLQGKWKVVLLMTALVLQAVLAAFRDSQPLFEDSFHVKVLDKEQFIKHIDTTDEVWLVDFYAPWCPHCRHFAPEYEKIAAFYVDSKVVHVGSVDCTKNDELCDREEILGYPAIKLFNVPPSATKGIKLTGYGNRNMKGVINWVETLLKENNMKSGIDVENIDQQIELIRNERVRDDAGNVARALENSIEMKYARLQDAGSAAIFGLENALFMGQTTLEGERYEAAVKWVEALASTFPLTTNRLAFQELADIIKQRKSWDQSSWTSIVAKWKEHAKQNTFPNTLLKGGDESWLHCTTYTCGLWTLFHSMSAQTNAPECDFKPSELASAIRLFVKHFFGCAECVQHFLRANPERVITDLARKDHEGANAVTYWLWKMHSIVNRVTKKPFWPSLKQCPICFADGTTVESLDPAQLVESQIVAFVHSAYSQRDDMILSMTLAHSGLSGLVATKLEGAWTQSLLLLGVVGCCVALRAKTRGITWVPSHKHAA